LFNWHPHCNISTGDGGGKREVGRGEANIQRRGKMNRVVENLKKCKRGNRGGNRKGYSGMGGVTEKTRFLQEKNSKGGM